MAEELEKWRYPRFFSDTIDENDRIIYMNDEDSKHIAQVLRMRKGDTAKKIMDGLAAENPEFRSEQLLYRFFVRLLNGDMDCLSRLENEIDEYENVYLFKSESGKDVFEKLSAWRRELLRIKRYYEQLTLIFDDFSLPEMWAGRRSALPTFCRCLLGLAGGHSVFSFAAAASKIIFTQVSRPRAALMARS